MRQYIIDAFTDEVFNGNPAAVCILDRWIDDALMQNIAKENNFFETAFHNSGILPVSLLTFFLAPQIAMPK